MAGEGTAYRAGRTMGVALRAVTPLGVVVAAALVASNFATGGLHAALLAGALTLDAALIVVVARFTRSWFWGLLAIYVSLVAAGSVIADAERPSRLALGAVAAGTIAAAVGAMALAIRQGRRSRELERLLFSESTSIAFFATMLAALTYGLLESWLEVPHVSAWVVWGVGMGAWFVASTLMRRRYS